MRFLADESCDFRVVRALRAAGHDVQAIAEVAPGSNDDVIVGMAIQDDRILLTEDRDLGQLVYASGHSTCNVVLLRYPSRMRRELPGVVVDFAAAYGPQLAGRFIIIEPGRVRIGGKP